jgi:threonine/homoserine/homoserine lactone efflux protein
MWLLILCKGILIGLVASIPLGPIGVICIQRTLSKSYRSGFVSGLGAALADTLFATIAMLFLSVVLVFIETHIDLLKVLGGICVIIAGMRIFLRNLVLQIRRNRTKKNNLWGDFLSLFLLTFTNPAYILMFMALFAAFGIRRAGLPMGDVALLIAGVYGGATLWWLLLTSLVNLFRKKFRPRHLLALNRISGGLIVLLGAVSILSLFINMNVNRIIN